MTRGTHAVWNDVDVPCIEHFDPHTPFAIGDLEMSPYPVPHDAREPAQFVVGNGATCIGVLSDAGSVTPHMCRMLQACDSLLIEFNHDSAMLANGPYPESLKRRVGGAYGHLSNMQAADLLRRIDTSRLQHVVLKATTPCENCPHIPQCSARHGHCHRLTFPTLLLAHDHRRWCLIGAAIAAVVCR